jgi:hypothetical protein
VVLLVRDETVGYQLQSEVLAVKMFLEKFRQGTYLALSISFLEVGVGGRNVGQTCRVRSTFSTFNDSFLHQELSCSGSPRQIRFSPLGMLCG